MSSDAVPTGTAELDTLLGGGFPPRSLVLVSGDSGTLSPTPRKRSTAKQTFAVHHYLRVLIYSAAYRQDNRANHARFLHDGSDCDSTDSLHCGSVRLFYCSDLEKKRSTRHNILSMGRDGSPGGCGSPLRHHRSQDH